MLNKTSFTEYQNGSTRDISIDLDHCFEFVLCSQGKMRKNLILGGGCIKTHRREIIYFCERTSMRFIEDTQIWKSYLRKYFWSGTKKYVKKTYKYRTELFIYVLEESENRSIVLFLFLILFCTSFSKIF